MTVPPPTGDATRVTFTIPIPPVPKERPRVEKNKHAVSDGVALKMRAAGLKPPPKAIARTPKKTRASEEACRQHARLALAQHARNFPEWRGGTSDAIEMEVVLYVDHAVVTLIRHPDVERDLAGDIDNYGKYFGDSLQDSRKGLLDGLYRNDRQIFSMLVREHSE